MPGQALSNNHDKLDQNIVQAMEHEFINGLKQIEVD